MKQTLIWLAICLVAAIISPQVGLILLVTAVLASGFRLAKYVHGRMNKQESLSASDEAYFARMRRSCPVKGGDSVGGSYG